MTHRRLNGSLAFRVLAADVLWPGPPCDVCSAQATEVHLGGGCCVDLPYSEDAAKPVCRDCHDATGCTAPADTRVGRFLTGL